jgi:hypothetical protein
MFAAGRKCHGGSVSHAGAKNLQYTVEKAKPSVADPYPVLF